MHILPSICSAQQSLQRFTAFQVLEPPVSTGDDTGPYSSPLTGNRAVLGAGEEVWHQDLAKWATTHWDAAKCPGATGAKPLRTHSAVKEKETCLVSRFRGLL